MSPHGFIMLPSCHRSVTLTSPKDSNYGDLHSPLPDLMLDSQTNAPVVGAKVVVATRTCSYEGFRLLEGARERFELGLVATRRGREVGATHGGE